MRVLTSLLILTVASTCFAQQLDWPQFRGPDRTSISKETGLLQTWPDGGPKQDWVYKNAGLGYSSFAVTGGKLYTLGSLEKKEHLICLNAETGEHLWSTPISEELKNDWGNGPRGTPTVDGDRVYALSGPGALVCANAEDGQVRWKKSMLDVGGKPPFWGYSESVLIDGDNVVCTPGGKQGTVLALNKMTGEGTWQSKEITDGAQYASIVTADLHGKHQLIQLTQQHLFGLDATNGSVLWQVDWPGKTAVIPTPIVRNDYVYVSSGYNVGCMLVKIGKNFDVQEIYKNRNMKNHHGGVLLVGESLYGYSDGPGWMCQNLMSGDDTWTEKRKLGKGAIAYADGRLYCLSERSGEVVLIDATDEGWNERGRMTLEPQSEIRAARGKIWTHPVIVNGKLYLRDQDLIYCYDVKG